MKYMSSPRCLGIANIELKVLGRTQLGALGLPQRRGGQ